MRSDLPQFGTGDALAVMVIKFGRLAVSLADGAGQPFTE
jgi:hypothetical protein